MVSQNILTLRRDMDKPLAHLAPLPELFEVVRDDGTMAGAWEWIVEGAFPGSGLSYEAFLKSSGCTREQVFFFREYSQPSATAAVMMEGDCARIVMAAVHPFARGMRFGARVVNGALEYIRERGVKRAEALVKAEASAAVKMFLELGFEPVIESEADRAAWDAAKIRISEYCADRPEVMRLWPEGEIPYWEDGNCIPAVEAYPVEGARGAVVICPGGAYCIKASHEGRQIARMLNEAGVSAYVLDYRVRPCHYEAPLADAKRAIRTVRAMGYEKVGVMGFSAGGHLACSAATLYDAGDANAADPVERFSSRPDAFIPCYPVVSFVNCRHQGSLDALLGKYRNRFALHKRFSAELNVTGDTPPAFIWHTMTDQSVPVENSLNLASALTHAGVLFEMHIYPEGPHGLGLAAGDPVVGEWSAQCQRWLCEMGFGRRGEEQ